MDTKEELIKAIKIDQQLLKNKWARDLYTFNRDVLNVDKGKGMVSLSGFHIEMCEFVDKNPQKQKLILVPRGHLKSSLVTIGKTISWILENPSVRILIANATYQMSISFLNVIQRQLKNNPLIAEIYGPIATNPEKWSENMITLDQAKEVGGKKEATVFCYGMGGNLVSQHFDKIILDDVVNEDTVSTREQIEKTIQFYRLCQPLLEKGGEMLILGTRWHDEDLYGWIMDQENGIIQDFDVFERKAIEDELWDNSLKKFVKGTVLWPEKFSLDELSMIRRRMGPYTFSTQYQNEVVAPENADFKREWFRYYENSDLNGKDLNRYTLVDPAISLEQDADYTAIITVGIDKYGNIFILDILRERLKVDGLINALFYQYEKWHPREIGIEDVAFQKALRYALRQEEEKRNRFLPTLELKPHGRSKDQRVRGLQPLYANGTLYHNRDLIFNVYLEDELLRFPRGKHDDMVDALAYALDVMHPPQPKVTSYHKHKYLY